MSVQNTNEVGRGIPASKPELEVDFTSPKGEPVGESLEVEFASDLSPPSAKDPAAPPGLEVELEEASSDAAPSAASSAPVAAPSAATTAVSTKELVSIYLLAMHLPSADLVASDYTDADGVVVRRIKEWRGETQRVAREIETMRRSIYRRIERVWCMVREFGVWTAVTEQGVREAERISKEVRERLRQLGLAEVAHRYYVRAIKVYLEPSDAKMLLDAAVAQLSSEVEELGRRIKEAEASQNRRLVKELMYKKEYVSALLDTFKKYIEKISR